MVKNSSLFTIKESSFETRNDSLEPLQTFEKSDDEPTNLGETNMETQVQCNNKQYYIFYFN